MDEEQPWHPYYLGNPLYALLLMVFFEWGVAMHDLEVENLVKGTRKFEENKTLHAGLMRNVKRQALKDYLGKQLFSVASKICGWRCRTVVRRLRSRPRWTRRPSPREDGTHVGPLVAGSLIKG